MGEVTPLSLPAGLPYPITITRLIATEGQEVKRGDALLEYSFLSATRARANAALEREGKPVPPEHRRDDLVGSWSSTVAGTVQGWRSGVKAGMKVSRSDR
jgi:hypothetical protein